MKQFIQKAALVTVLAGTSLFMSVAPAQAAQGLYSAKALMGAEVYTMKGKHQEVGEVSNILLDERMKMTGVIITTGAILGLGGKAVYVPVGRFSVKTEHPDKLDEVSYKVYVDASEKEMSQFPVADQGWWVGTKKAAVHAWDKTKSGVQSGWDAVKHATSKAYDATKHAAEGAVDSVKGDSH
ncbi:PRC-barrel domain-containing protein [Halothiobacillus sp.]|uniref:PRC-barrel domain-containing protein n=1 Tax=Halothiobacillus sp. TaxID=1891311 RepID=UPI002AD4CA88|nr:PRC-barrel domain-containing protein [Halothiobacillus sp.]